MKSNKLQIIGEELNPQLTHCEALDLVDRYFDAQTTEFEELMLKNYVVNEGREDAAFDEVRALMGLMVYAKSHVSLKKPSVEQHVDEQIGARNVHEKMFCEDVILRKSRWTVVRKVAAIAAVVCVVGGAALAVTHYKMQNQCIAYVDGHKTTDRDEVVRAMHQSVADVGFNEGDAVVKDQLHDMFNTINQIE